MSYGHFRFSMHHLFFRYMHENIMLYIQNVYKIYEANRRTGFLKKKDNDGEKRTKCNKDYDSIENDDKERKQIY